MSDVHKAPGKFQYENMVFSSETSPEKLDRVKTMHFRKTDQVVVGYPKSGTCWLRYLLAVIHNNGQEVPQKWTVFENTPSLEMCGDRALPQLVDDHLESLPSPRILGTHLPSYFIEPQIREGQMKVVVIIRNPKDTLVSLYHFYRMLIAPGKFQGSWDQFFKLFKCDSLWGGNVIKHHVGWWHLRRQPNVLIVKYEDMKKNLSAMVRKLADFCGRNLSDQVVESIANMSTFEKLKNNPAINNEDSEDFDFTVSKFMRKGQVGDWKNYFSASQNEHVDRLCEVMAKPVGLFYDFE